MRTMSEILDGEPSLATMPDTHESDSRESTDTSAKAESKPEQAEKPAKVEAKPEKQPAEKPEANDDEHEDEPADLAGFKKALAAARGDKRKARKQWQEANSRLEAHQREVAALRAQLSQIQTQQQAPKQQPVDLTEEGFYGKGHEAVKAYVAAQVEALRRDFDTREQARAHARNQKSFDTAKARHEDFGEAFGALMEAVRTNPSLEATILSEEDPGEAAYAYGKTYLRARNFSSIDELEKSIEARVRAEYESGQQQSRPPAKPMIPKSIAGARGTGAGVSPTWNGPRSMNEILRR